MGYKDTIRQKQNVYRMNMLGSKVHPVKSGSKTLKMLLMKLKGLGNKC